MRFRYKGRKYKVHPAPFVILFLLLIILIVLGIGGCNLLLKSGSGSASSNTTTSAGSGSSAPSSGANGTVPATIPSSEEGIMVGGEPSSEGTVSAVSSLSSGEVASTTVSSGAVVPTDLPEGKVSDWNLMLLGPAANAKIDQDLDIEKIKFDLQYVDARAAPSYQKMFDAAQKAGITLYLRSGYRSIATQRTNYNANIQAEIAKGTNEAEATRLTNLYFTVPGHSEHHSGLAFDIITPEYHKDVYDLNEAFAKTDAYQWLSENCAEYGFILRYPKDKTDITQINFEPWHYRYVGVEHAQYIMGHDLCLEEYVNLMKAAGR